MQESHLVPAGGWPYAHDGDTHGQLASAGTVVTGLPTVAERGHPPVPALRLVTGNAAAETQLSGARAGRGDVELPLPEIPTVSREHAEFTYAEGQWWVTNLGRNGLALNGVPLEGQRPVRDGDSIGGGPGRTRRCPGSRSAKPAGATVGTGGAGVPFPAR